MANEIRSAGSITLSKSGASFAGTGSVSITMTGTNIMGNVQSVGTSAELIDFQELADIRYLYLKNEDATNYIEVALDSGMAYGLCKLRPGEFAIMEPLSGVLWAKSDTAACDLQIVAAES